MPFIQHACSAQQHPCSLDTLSHRITWLPKACRNAAVRQQVAEAVIKAICGVTASETTPDKVVVRARRRHNNQKRHNNAKRRLRREHGRVPSPKRLLPEPGAPGPPRRVERDWGWQRGPHEGAPKVNYSFQVAVLAVLAHLERPALQLRVVQLQDRAPRVLRRLELDDAAASRDQLGMDHVADGLEVVF